MKKDEFLKICRGLAKEPLTAPEEAMFGAIGEGIEKAFELDTVERNKSLNAITEKLGTMEDGKTVASVIRDLATQIDNIEAKAKRSLSVSDKYKLGKALDDNKELIQRAAKSKENWSIEFKARRAAAIMTSSNMVTGTVALATDNYLEDVELMVIQYPPNFILDAINSRQVTKVPAVMFAKYETTTDNGAPALTAAGVAKPLVSKNFAREYFYRAKYAGRIEYQEEMEIDFEQLLLDVIALFEEQVVRVWNDAVLALVLAYASAYTTSSLDGTMVNPDAYGVMMAGMAWGAGNNFTYDELLMNPADYWALKGTQDKNGNYKMNPFTAGFAGLNLFLSNSIPVGTITLGTKQSIKEQHSAFILRSGQYADQLIENEYTIIGEVFSITQLPTIKKASWVTLNIATAKTALAVTLG